MPRYINSDKKVHIQVYNDEHEEYIVLEQTIAECLDSYTDEGCPEPADVQEVKHGKWRECRFGNGITVPFRKYYICNQCNHTSQKKSRYCPNCGAKMDGYQLK